MHHACGLGSPRSRSTSGTSTRSERAGCTSSTSTSASRHGRPPTWHGGPPRCAATGIGLVHTVHDLDNPHLVDQAPFHRAVEVLVECRRPPAHPHADGGGRRRRPLRASSGRACRTRTSSRSIACVRRQTGSPSGRVRPRRDHAPNLDVELVESLADCARRAGRRARARPATASNDRTSHAVLALGAAPGVHVELADELTDEQLWHRLETAAAVVLPYRWGTHSGLLEAAARPRHAGARTARSAATPRKGREPCRPGFADRRRRRAVGQLGRARRRRRTAPAATRCALAPAVLRGGRRRVSSVLWYVHDVGSGHLTGRRGGARPPSRPHRRRRRPGRRSGDAAAIRPHGRRCWSRCRQTCPRHPAPTVGPWHWAPASPELRARRPRSPAATAARPVHDRGRRRVRRGRRARPDDRAARR